LFQRAGYLQLTAIQVAPRDLGINLFDQLKGLGVALNRPAVIAINTR
jgi:hypothetical protein